MLHKIKNAVGNLYAVHRIVDYVLWSKDFLQCNWNILKKFCGDIIVSKQIPILIPKNITKIVGSSLQTN